MEAATTPSASWMLKPTDLAGSSNQKIAAELKRSKPQWNNSLQRSVMLFRVQRLISVELTVSRIAFTFSSRNLNNRIEVGNSRFILFEEWELHSRNVTLFDGSRRSPSPSPMPPNANV
jgi:hypothetical protein